MQLSRKNHNLIAKKYVAIIIIVVNNAAFLFVVNEGYWMNFYTLALGLFMLCHGSYILFTRAKAKHHRARLDFMSKALGRHIGFAIYSLIYVILPIGFGAYISYAGVNGIALDVLFTAQ